jgi:hypothetical protein
MAAEGPASEGARLLCLALPLLVPILRAVTNLVHELRIHPNAKVRKIAQEKLPPPQRTADLAHFEDGANWQ